MRRKIYSQQKCRQPLAGWSQSQYSGFKIVPFAINYELKKNIISFKRYLMKNKSKYVSKTNSNLAWNDLLSRQIRYTESSHSVNSLRVNIKATKLSHSKHLEMRIIFI